MQLSFFRRRVGGRAYRLAIAALLLCGSTLRADDTWIGFDATTASWTSPTNWSQFQYPFPLDDVFFNRPSASRGQADVNFNFTMNSALISGSSIAGNYVWHGAASNASLTVTKALTLNNSVGNTSFSIDGGLTVNAGSTSIGNSSTLTLNSATLKTDISLFGSGQLYFNSGSFSGAVSTDTASTGTVSFSFGSSNLTRGNFLGSGKVKAATHVFNVSEVLRVTGSGDVTLNNSTINLGSGASISVNSGGKLHADSFTLKSGTMVVGAGGSVDAVGGVNVAADLFTPNASLTVDGAAATVSSTGTSIWGDPSLQSKATVTFANSGVGTFNVLQVSRSSQVNLSSSARLTASVFTLDDFSTLTIAGGTFTDRGAATFKTFGTVNLTSGGLELGGDATFADGEKFNWSGGTITTIGANRVLTFDDAAATLAGGKALGGGLTLKVLNNASFTSNTYVDLANNTGSATLLVDGSGSKFSAGSISVSDWGRTSTDTATVTFSNSAAGSFAGGLRMAGFGGKALLNLNSGANLNVASLEVCSVGTGSGTLNIAGGTLSDSGTAVFGSGSRINLSSGGLFLGDSTISTGAKLDWSGGTLNVGSGKTLTLDGGSISVTNGGGGLTDNATLRINSNGLFTSTGYFDIATSSTSGGVGTLIVDGANARYTTASVSYLARESGNSGTFLFANGGAATFSSGFTLANNGGSAFLNIGTSSVINTPAVTVGGGTGGTATFNIAGGSLNNTGAATFLNGSRVNLSAGTLLIGGDATFGTGANLNWTGGTLNWAAGKTLTLDGGSISTSVISALPSGATLSIKSNGLFNATTGYLDIANGGSGTLIVDGTNARMRSTGPPVWSSGLTDSATISFVNGGVGTFVSGVAIGLNGGKALVNIGTNSAIYATPLLVGNLGGIATGSNGVTINLAGGTLGASTMQLGKGATINYSAGTMSGGPLSMSDDAKISMIGDRKALKVTSLTLAGTSKIDLSESGLIVDYTGASSFTTIKGYITTGRTGGTWAGNGLTSSIASSGPNTFGVGIVESSAALGASGGSFFNQSADGTAVLVRMTYLGDCNLDGKVDIVDLGNLAGNYQSTTANWINGDFNYDGKVNIVDLGLLAGNWHGEISLTAAMASLDFSPVPEPGMLGLAVAALVLRRRRAA